MQTPRHQNIRPLSLPQPLAFRGSLVNESDGFLDGSDDVDLVEGESRVESREGLGNVGLGEEGCVFYAGLKV